MNEPEVQGFHTSDLRKSTLKKVNVWPGTGRRSSSSRASFSCPHVFLCFSLFCWIGSLLGHPQCLDYGPPFQPPSRLEFCSAYENFGCCDRERDNSIAAKYHEILDYLDPRGHKLCGAYIKDILCQVGWKIRSFVLCFGLTWGHCSPDSLSWLSCWEKRCGSRGEVDGHSNGIRSSACI